MAEFMEIVIVSSRERTAMSNQMPLSIIVPVYNMEEFLPKCLDSIIAQTMRKWELICVNDGSTDGSQCLLEEYADRDSRIRVVHKENGGLVSARKAGVAEARGKYVGFVDPDDWIEKQMYEKLYGFAVENDVELVSSDYCQEGNYTAVSHDAVEAGIYKGEKMQELRDHAILYLTKKNKGLSGSLCTKLFRTELFKHTIENVPNEITVSEDKAALLSYLLECNSAAVVHEAYYHYVIRSNSMLNGLKPDYLINVHRLYHYFMSLYDHHNFTYTMRIQAELYITQFLIKGINSYLGFANSNLLWIDPYWMDNLPDGSRVAIYGAGALGRKYWQQLNASDRLAFAGCIDFEAAKLNNEPFKVCSPLVLPGDEYDMLVITVKNKNVADNVKERLLVAGIPAKKILWFRQDEIFWRFAEADGLLTE